MNLQLVSPASAMRANLPGHRVAEIRVRCFETPPEIWAICECGERVTAATPESLHDSFADHRKGVGAARDR